MTSESLIMIRDTVNSKQAFTQEQNECKKNKGYRELLGDKAWFNLHPDIRERFSEENSHNVRIYSGVMEEVYLSFMGKIIAHLCRLIGTPLALYQANNVPTIVKVYPDSETKGIVWDRYYIYEGRRINRVKSAKCLLPEGGLIEKVGFGFGMHLKVSEENGALCFRSTEFFWQLGRLRLRIPDIISPGKTTVCQEALSEHRFRFKLEVVHPIVGKLYWQMGVFNELSDS